MRVSVAMPDHFRSRVNSIVVFLSDGIAPIGVVAGGLLASTLGVTGSMALLGAAVILLVPVLFWIPGFTEFFRRPPEKLVGFFMKAYPRAFEEK